MAYHRPSAHTPLLQTLTSAQPDTWAVYETKDEKGETVSIVTPVVAWAVVTEAQDKLTVARVRAVMLDPTHSGQPVVAGDGIAITIEIKRAQRMAQILTDRRKKASAPE